MQLDRESAIELGNLIYKARTKRGLKHAELADSVSMLCPADIEVTVERLASLEKIHSRPLHDRPAQIVLSALCTALELDFATVNRLAGGVYPVEAA